jgi:hypothetical protein
LDAKITPQGVTIAREFTFRVLGGVPRRGIYDNMRTAVDKVGRGKALTINLRFQAMTSHYLWEPEFCNPAAGWEKGQVEKNVQDARHRLWQTAPPMETLGALNDWLEDRCQALWRETQHGREAAVVADRAIESVHAAGIRIIEQLTPRLAALVERTSRQRLVLWRLRSIIGTAAVALLALTLSGGYVYAIGYTTGRTNGELVGHTISAAMAAGPAAAMDWASLMALNDPQQALASCKRAIQRDGHGRRYCAMPVWIDPPAPAPRHKQVKGARPRLSSCRAGANALDRAMGSHLPRTG